MAVVIDNIVKVPIEMGVEAPEDTAKQNGAVAFVKATVSGAAGEAISVKRFGIKNIWGCIPGIGPAAITTISEANDTVTIPNTNGVYQFAVFGEREGIQENFDAARLL